jgi:SET domain-containing protein
MADQSKIKPKKPSKIIVRQTKRFGLGVFALKKIRRGEVVAKFDGPFYDNKFDGWNRDLLTHTIQCGPALWRDSLGPARYMNHSCDPNCGIQRRFEVVAMRTIEAGEQITWDYEMTEKSWWYRLKCRCGARECRKVIGSYSLMPKKTRQKYAGFISSWLTRKKPSKVRLKS